MAQKHIRNLVLKGKPKSLSFPLIMAIVNATDDSFYAKSRNSSDDDLQRTVERAVSEGADILDIGGCSTRPGSAPVAEDVELERVSHAFSVVRSVAGDIPTSVDTFRASVARMAVNDFDCDIINDVSAFSLDCNLFSTVVELQKAYILTHFPQQNAVNSSDFCEKSFADVPEDRFLSSVLRFFAAKIDELRSSGFNNDIIVDPGFGFGKTVEQNYSLLRNLSLLECFHEPILVGVSRKSMIYRPLHITADQALNGTTVLDTLALANGANIQRVHDVREAVETRALFSLTNQI